MLFSDVTCDLTADVFKLISGDMSYLAYGWDEFLFIWSEE